MNPRAIAVGALLTGLLACAPGGAGEPSRIAPEDAVAIVVNHNVPGAGALTVRLVAPVGSWQLLGNVSPAQTETFVIEEEAVAGSYRLVAELPDGRAVRSRGFSLTGQDGVRWNLYTNIVTPIDVEVVDEDEDAREGEPDEIWQ